MALSSHDLLALVHAVFACIAVLFVLPASILTARYLRSKRYWFRIHLWLNLLAIALIVLVFGLGVAAVMTADLGTQFNGPNSDIHHKVGLALFILIFVQGILGFAAHRTPRSEEASQKHPIRWLHAAFGIVTVSLLYWQVWNGMQDEWPEMSTNLVNTPMSVRIIFWILFFAEVSAYVFGLANVALKAITIGAARSAGYRKINGGETPESEREKSDGTHDTFLRGPRPATGLPSTFSQED